MKGIIVLLTLLMSLSSCSQYLRTGPAGGGEITGTYNLILYGGNYLTDLETIAVLDKQGDPYEIVPYAPAFDYRVLKGLRAPEALARAKQFVLKILDTSGYYISSIYGPGGEVIGYEVRPLYNPFRFGTSDILNVTYWVKDDKVLFRVRLKPPLENRLEDHDGRIFGRER